MTRLRRFTVALACVAALSSPLTSASCRHAPDSIVTPQGRVAYQSEDALDAIGTLQHAAITARRQNVIPTATMRAIVKATMAAAGTIDVAIDNGTGAQAAYRTALTGISRAKQTLTADQLAKLQTAFTTAETILTVLAGGS